MTRTSTVIQYATHATALLVLATFLHIGPKAWAEARFIAETAFENTPHPRTGRGYGRAS